MARLREELLPWDSQPQEAAGASQEWPAPAFLILGGQTVDLATSRQWSIGTTASQGLDSYGCAISPGTAGNSIQQSGISAAAQTKCTFVCVFRIDTGREYSFLARTSTSNSGFAIGNGTGNSGGLSYGLHKGGAATLSEVVLTAGVTYVMVASHDQASGEYYVVARPIRGGATLRASGTNATASLAGSGTASIGVNASPNDFIGSVGFVWQAFEFLPESKSGALLQDPWQLFASRSMWVPVSAGGGTDGNASTTPATSTLTAPTATGSGSAQASAAPAGSTLTAPTATATGTAAGHATATGAPAGLTLTAPTATASGSAQASGALAGATLTAPTGTASSAGHALASGAPAGVTMTAPTATATGSAQAFAAFMATVLTAPTATASNGDVASVLGSLAGSARRIGPTRSNRQTATRSNRQTATR